MLFSERSTGRFMTEISSPSGKDLVDSGRILKTDQSNILSCSTENLNKIMIENLPDALENS